MLGSISDLSVHSLDSFVGLSRQLLIVDYACVAMLTILVYELFDLLPREVEFIWSQKWRFINGVYLFCHYTPILTLALALLVFHGPVRACGSGFFGVVALSYASLVICECCFMMRTYAIWGASRKAAVFLSILTAGMVCALALDLSKLRRAKTFSLDSILSLCGIGGPASCAMWGLIIVLLVDAIVMVMIVLAKIKVYDASDTNRLLQKIYKDSILYFFLNSLTAAVAIVLYLKTPELALISSRLASALTCLVTSRMIIGLKEQGSCDIRPFKEDEECFASMSTIQFRYQRRGEAA